MFNLGWGEQAGGNGEKTNEASPEGRKASAVEGTAGRATWRQCEKRGKKPELAGNVWFPGNYVPVLLAVWC